MLPIDHHVQNTLYKFNREMKRLNQGGDTTFAGLGSHQRTVPMSIVRKWLRALSGER
jgi:hypothetical protein